MYPIGTEVEYDGYYGVVTFNYEDQQCTICIKVIPDDIPRSVCLVVYKQNFHKIHLINGNRRDS